MPSLRNLQPGSRFTVPSLGLTGVLVKVNESRAHVQLEGGRTLDWTPNIEVIPLRAGEEPPMRHGAARQPSRVTPQQPEAPPPKERTMSDTATVVETSKVAPKAKKTKKAAKKTAAKSGPTIREQVFKLLSHRPSTGPYIKEKLGLSGVPSLLKDEGVSASPRIRRRDEEGVRGVVYELTARGKKDLADGKVDDNAAEPSGGKDWPDGR